MPAWSPGWVWTVIGAPVIRWACADRPHDPLDARGQSGLVDGALQERRLHASVGDPLGDVADEQVDHRVRDVVPWLPTAGPPEVKKKGT